MDSSRSKIYETFFILIESAIMKKFNIIIKIIIIILILQKSISVLFAGNVEDFIANINEQINIQIIEYSKNGNFDEIEKICSIYKCIEEIHLSCMKEYRKKNEIDKYKMNIRAIIDDINQKKEELLKRKYLFDKLQKTINYALKNIENYSHKEQFAIDIGKMILSLLESMNNSSLQGKIASIVSQTNIFNFKHCNNKQCTNIKAKIEKYIIYENEIADVKTDENNIYYGIEKNYQVNNMINIEDTRQLMKEKKKKSEKRITINEKEILIQGKRLLNQFEYRQARDFFLNENMKNYVSLAESLLKLKKEVKVSYYENNVQVDYQRNLNEILNKHDDIFTSNDLKNHKRHFRSFLWICDAAKQLMVGNIEKGKNILKISAMFFAETKHEKEKIQKVLNDISNGKRNFDKEYFEKIFDNKEKNFYPNNTDSSYFPKSIVHSSKTLPKRKQNKRFIPKIIWDKEVDTSSNGWQYFKTHDYQRAMSEFHNRKVKELASTLYEWQKMITNKYAQSSDILNTMKNFENMIENQWFNDSDAFPKQMNINNHILFFHFINWMNFGDYRLKEKKLQDAIENYYNAKRFAYLPKFQAIINEKLEKTLSSEYLSIDINKRIYSEVKRINKILIKNINETSQVKKIEYLILTIKKIDNAMQNLRNDNYREQLSNIFMKRLYFEIKFLKDESMQKQFADEVLSKISGWCCRSEDCRKAIKRLKKLTD